MKKIFFFLVLLLLTTQIFPQRKLKISILREGEKIQVSSILSNGMTFISTKEFSKAVNSNYFFNSRTQKAEIKFDTYSLTFTAWNQFIILRKRNSNWWKVFQLPISSKILDDDIYFPMDYTLKYFELGLGKKLHFEKGSKIVTIGNSIKPNLDFDENKLIKDEVVSNFDIYGIEIQDKSNGTLIRLKSQTEIKNVRSNILEDKLLLFLPAGVTIDPSISSAEKDGFIRKIEVKSIGTNQQIEFLLKQGYKSSEAFPDSESKDLLITIQSDAYSKFEDKIDSQKKDFKLDVIVIDAGHGGKDSGAIGVNKVLEKNVNLAIAKRLKKLLNKNIPEIKVIMTRDGDNFVELFKRGKIANEANGDLFISIHCNSTIKKPSNANGFEVYVLRPGKTDDAIAIAEFENSVINMENHPEEYEELTEENFILVTMAHSANMRFSEKLSDILNSKWKNKMSIQSRGVKQAGLIVLIGASMPGILIETGFLSNTKEERYLNSNYGQQKIAETIFNSIKEYKNYYNQVNGVN